MESEVSQLEEQLFKLWGWFDGHKKQIKVGAIASVALVAVVSFVVWQRAEKTRRAGEALSDVFVPLAMAGPNARGTGLEGYQKVANAYPGHEAGAQAMVLAAASLFTDGKYKDALAEFDRFLHEHPDSPLVGQTLLGRAACFDALNQTNEAVSAYNTLINQHPAESMIPQAKFALARLYEAQGKLEQARAFYEEVANNRYSSVGSEAGIRLEELLQKHPELIPAAPVSLPSTKPAAAPNPAPSLKPAPAPAATSNAAAPAVKK